MSDLTSKSPGRVNLEVSEADAQVPGFNYSTTAPSNAGQSGIRGNLERSVLNQAYFSAGNFQIIQNAIRFGVFQTSGEIIDPVGTDDLFMIMRALYLQYSRNLPDQIPEQIAELNERVVTWSVPKILAEVSMYRTYLKDISTLPEPLAHPVLQTTAGTRTLPYKPFF